MNDEVTLKEKVCYAFANLGNIGCAIVVPAILSVVGAIIFAIGYPLTKEKLEVQTSEIKMKRAVK